MSWVKVGEANRYVFAIDLGRSRRMRHTELMDQRAAGGKEDTVSLSAQVNPDYREDRVAELRTVYRAGEYRVQNEEVSSKIIERHLTQSA